MGFDVQAATVAELEAENQRLMAERAEVDTGYKALQTAIARELDRRAGIAKIDDAFGGLTDEQRVAILDVVKGA